jgi:hypothetical protein
MLKINNKNLCFVLLSIWLTANFCFAKYGGGSGTANDPYLIYTPEQLNDLGKPANEGDLNRHFALMADIDLGIYSGSEFNIIGEDRVSFSGVFDGRGHNISNFTYSPLGQEMVGIFGKVEGYKAVIKNLGVIDSDIAGEAETAPLVASLINGTIENCWAKGGDAECLFAGFCGGLVGDFEGGVIANCYAEEVTVKSDFSFSSAGGLVGRNSWGKIINSFAACYVSSTSGDKGALVGIDYLGEYSSCFWDSTISSGLTGIGNITDPPEVVGATTTNMQKSSTFIDAGWDIVTMDHQPRKFVWRMCIDDVVYPRLNIEYEQGDFVCPDGVDLLDLAALAEEWQIEKLNIDIDFHFDRQIDFLDWAKLASAWQSQSGDLNYDVMYDIAPATPDDIIDGKDVKAFVEYWLANGAAVLNTDISPFITDDVVDFLDYAEFAKNYRGD